MLHPAPVVPIHIAPILIAALLPCIAHAAPGTLSNAPLFADTHAKPNVMLAIDDSGSMDSEVLFLSNDGALWWNTDEMLLTFTGIDDVANGLGINFNLAGVSSTEWKKYVYLFPNGTGTGNRIYADSTHDHFAIPPLPQYAFARSPDYNKAYFDPAVIYAPWTSYGLESFGAIAPAAAPSEPNPGNGSDPATSSFKFDLTSHIASYASNRTFRMYQGMSLPANTRLRIEQVGSSATGTLKLTSLYNFIDAVADPVVASVTDTLLAPLGTSIALDSWIHVQSILGGALTLDIPLLNTVNETDALLDTRFDIAVDYDPAAYYTADGSGSYWQCEGPAVIDIAALSPLLRLTLDPVLATLAPALLHNGKLCVGANAVTGSCANPNPAHYRIFQHYPSGLRVDAGGAIDALGPDGRCLVRHEVATGSGQMQNFANWFSYYRKRHQALRAGTAAAFNGMSEIRTGIFTINNRTTVGMLDFDTQRNNFFRSLYDIDGNSGGTPNRQALNHAGTQYQRTGSGAPITESCQKNFTLLFTDGFSSLDSGLPTPGNVDGGAGVPFADSYPNTLGDLALKYYNTNLRPDIQPAGNVKGPVGCNDPVPDARLDCNRNLHMNTYTIGLGAQGSLFGITHDNVADVHATPPLWPDVNTSRDPTQVDDLLHATVNGRGDMFNADTPAALANSMTAALQSIQAQIGAAASVTFNTGQLDTHSAVYLALFNSASWSGDLQSFALDPDDGTIAASASWRAAQQLDARNLASNPRAILTHNGSDGVPLQWADLTAAQQNDLRTAPGGAQGAVADGQKRLDWLRGAHEEEGGALNLRVRASRLGDIVHSNPVYVAEPAINWPDTAPLPTAPGQRYSDFRAAQADRPGMIYVGANDGMLHAFRTSDGTETLAYVPSNLFSTANLAGLHYLTDRGYGHRYFVDLPPAVSDAYVPVTDGGSARWRTVLVGGERAGGRGLFALDVTDPAAFSEANAGELVLWEFDSGDDADLGYTFSRPVLALLNNGRWAAIFGNGYNDSGSGAAQLFILFLDGGLDGAWSAGSDYLKLSSGSGDAGDRNGLASPAVLDLDGNGTADRVYAGDLRGQMWAFDLTGAIGGWGPAYHSGTAPAPLFTAASDQPITTAPQVVRHPQIAATETNQPNLMLFFGTGQYMVDADRTSSATQTFYGVWDAGLAQLSRSQLVAQTTVTGFGADVRVLTVHAVPYDGDGAARRYGWYFDLPDIGERSVLDARVRGDILYYNTTIPSTEACTAGGGGWLMSVQLATGGSPEHAAFDYNGDDVVTDLDLVADGGGDPAAPAGEKFDQGLPAGSAFLEDLQFTPGTGTSTGSEIDRRRIEGLERYTGRLSWEELTH